MDEKIEALMKAYPTLDYWMCETLLKADKQMLQELIDSKHDTTIHETVKTVPITVENGE